MPLAPSFDTGGWFARDAGVLRAVGGVLLDGGSRRPAQLRRLLVAADAFGLAEEATTKALYDALSPKIDQVCGVVWCGVCGVVWCGCVWRSPGGDRLLYSSRPSLHVCG